MINITKQYIFSLILVCCIFEYIFFRILLLVRVLFYTKRMILKIILFFISLKFSKSRTFKNGLKRDITVTISLTIFVFNDNNYGKINSNSNNLLYFRNLKRHTFISIQLNSVICSS